MGKSNFKDKAHDLYITIRRQMNKDANVECHKPLKPKKTIKRAADYIYTMLNSQNQRTILYITLSWRRLLETSNAASEEVRDLMNSHYDAPASPIPPDSGDESSDSIELL